MSLREKKCVQARFLLGPAGSGKTFRCLTEIQAALKSSPEGPPLVLLAPKQATFQLERQLLAGGVLSGYTRLNILSFERLAQFILSLLQVPQPSGLLTEEGRVMVLRALLLRHRDELELFRQSAGRSGFARQVSQLLNEWQQHQYTPAKLRALSQQTGLGRELQLKLRDLALLLGAYEDWLGERGLQEGNRLLDAATESLKTKPRSPTSNGAPGALPSSISHPPSSLRISGLWLDGFAEMTPQELDLLAAILPHVERAVLAFCLDSESETEASWLSIWSSIGKTFQQCRQRIARLPECELSIETLKRSPKISRFRGNPALRHLETSWATPPRTPDPGAQPLASSIRIVACTNPEAEAAFAAREILAFVRNGRRFRDCAVLVRNLDGYHQTLARAFRRYHLPFFLDRRESAAHHPLAELTRNAVRTVTFGWLADDWFAALKAGFCSVDETEIDRLENEALARGWHGSRWLETIEITDNPGLAASLERLRQKLMPPFANLARQFARFQNSPTGEQLAEALREFWSEMKVEQTLENWSLGNREKSSIHQTVGEQMHAWLDNVALAFANEALPLGEWLPILEAGLGNLTVGMIPPALDQVLIGAVDRARNPDLKLMVVVGVNESVFPAAPLEPVILTEGDRDELGQCAVALGPGLRERLARERYLGYIACTRAGEKLVVTFARHDADGKSLNPSPFITQLRRIFPQLEPGEFNGPVEPAQAEHVSELAAPLFMAQNAGRPAQNWSELLELPAAAEWMDGVRALREPDPAEDLSAALAEKLYGPVLHSSVSRLEEFASCPFQFFVHAGLQAEERKTFELDSREQGSFQHEVLKMFHEQLPAGQKRWRDVTPAEARARIGSIATALAVDYRDGLLRANEQSRFTARMLTESLQDFVETLVTWMQGQYEFDPVKAELDFGFGNPLAPAWEIDLGNRGKLALRGRIDRVDLCRETDGRAWCVVLDYKSGGRKLDPLLVAHGVQLQLLAYLAVVRQWPDPQPLFDVKTLVPAGVFYVNLRGEYEPGDTRTDALAEVADARKRAYRHTGRFDAGVLTHLDRVQAADQFNYRLNKDGSLRAGSSEALPRAEFEGLLDRVETQLSEMGRAIFSGKARLDPYRKGRQTPCEFCNYRAACRLDPWTHQYRVLRAEGL